MRLKTLLKRAVMWLYLRELCNARAVAWVFDRFDLKEH